MTRIRSGLGIGVAHNDARHWHKKVYSGMVRLASPAPRVPLEHPGTRVRSVPHTDHHMLYGTGAPHAASPARHRRRSRI